MNPDRHAEEALELYTQWLNEWNRHWDAEGYYPVTRSDYDAEFAAPLDMRSITITGDLRTTILRCDPYQDEGGPHELIIIHRRLDIDDDWTLGCIIQHFDTLFSTVYLNDKLTYNGKDTPDA